MRKLTSILLLALLCCVLLGYHLVFHFQLAALKWEMKTFLLNKENHKDVIQITLSTEATKQLHWEDETEFRYRGEMYDVVEKKCKGNQVIIRCIADRKETTILQEYQKNNKRNPFHTITAQLITAQFILPNDFFLMQPGSIIKKNFIKYSASIQNRAPSISTPPPNIC